MRRDGGKRADAGLRLAGGICLAAVVAAATAFGSLAEIGPGVETTAAESGAGTESEPQAAETGAACAQETTRTKGSTAGSGSFDVDAFVLPAEAKVLVVVEGTGGSRCTVYAYEYQAPAAQTAKADAAFEEDFGTWELRFETAGLLGRNGMSNHRTVGDKTTPIGLFQLNTPFGQDPALDGFPENYIQVTEDYVWSDVQNRLLSGSTDSGERVGTFWYDEYYDYAIDCGFNRSAFPNTGSALFIHCQKQGRSDTSGCVAIPKEQMIALMRLYGKYGDGHCYIAQAPQGTFAYVYDSYGANNGLSPEGNFGG